jgi:hypothetical protein
MQGCACGGFSDIRALPYLTKDVSMCHKRQIKAFIRRIASNDTFVDQVSWADVANGSRFIVDADTGQVRP